MKWRSASLPQLGQRIFWIICILKTSLLLRILNKKWKLTNKQALSAVTYKNRQNRDEFLFFQSGNGWIRFWCPTLIMSIFKILCNTTFGIKIDVFYLANDANLIDPHVYLFYFAMRPVSSSKQLTYNSDWENGLRGSFCGSNRKTNITYL